MIVWAKITKTLAIDHRAVVLGPNQRMSCAGSPVSNRLVPFLGLTVPPP